MTKPSSYISIYEQPVNYEIDFRVSKERSSPEDELMTQLDQHGAAWDRQGELTFFAFSYVTSERNQVRARSADGRC
jgi:hypothetical protein